MIGEFDRDCREQGGCPPMLVKTQFREIRKQLLSGVEDKRRQEVGREFDELWKALQAQGELPGDDETGNVTKKLQAAEIKAQNDLEEHAKKENEPKFIKRKWKNQKEMKEHKQALLHQMAVTAMAYWKHTDKTHKKQNRDKQPLSAPAKDPASPPPEPTFNRLYPELPQTPTASIPPPYSGKNMQMPMLMIKDGVLNTDVIGEEEYVKAKEEVMKEIRQGIVQVEALRQDVMSIVAGARNVHQETLRSADRSRDTQDDVRSIESRDSKKSMKQSPFSSSTPKVEATEEEPRPLAEAVFQLRAQRERSDRSNRERRNEERIEEPEECSEIEEMEDEESQGWSGSDSEGDYDTKAVRLTGIMKSIKMPHSAASSRSGRPRSPYNLRQNKNKPKTFAMPLLEKNPGGREVYQPFSFTDMHCILDKMPPPLEGGGPWMEHFCKQTMGHKLALGDWRALLGQQLSSWDLTALETLAKTANLADKEPFAHHATAIGRAMRQQFPIPSGAMHALTFHIKPDENTAAFLSRCKNTWVDVAGVHPGSCDLQTTLFRKAVLEGLRTLSEEMHEHSGIDKPLGGIFEKWFGKWKDLVVSVFLSLVGMLAVLALCGCCCIPCIRSLCERIIVTAVERKHPQPPPYQMTQMETASLLGEPPTDSDSDSDSGEDKV
ncbi:hypothetical protein ABVT39_016273 [Epinephelus coioides]